MTKPIEAYGYDSVGPGWLPILESLDKILVNVVDNVKAQAKFQRLRNVDNRPDADVTINQVKEKFGGLRVYLTCNGMSHAFADEIHGAVHMAEVMSMVFCEKCGSKENVENRGVKDVKYSWVQNLCGSCHGKRDAEFERKAE